MSGAYSFALPVAFYPDYSKLGDATESYPYMFSYKVLIKSTKRITYISKPANSTVESDKSGRSATVCCSQPDRDIRIFYKSD